MDASDIKRLLDAATPGPWHLFTNRHPDRNGNSWGAVEARQHSAGGAGQYPDSTTITWTGPQGRANAALIAAAPELDHREDHRGLDRGVHGAREVTRARTMAWRWSLIGGI